MTTAKQLFDAVRYHHEDSEEVDCDDQYGFNSLFSIHDYDLIKADEVQNLSNDIPVEEIVDKANSMLDIRRDVRLRESG